MSGGSIRQHAESFAVSLVHAFLGRAVSTSTWLSVGFEHLDAYLEDGRLIIVIWHEFLALAPALLGRVGRAGKRRTPAICALASTHRDGALAGNIAERFGVTPIQGSSTRGGGSALRSFRKFFERRFLMIIAPDGPRGPRRSSARGLNFAGLDDVAILPVGLAMNDPIRLSSWDRMILPCPQGVGTMRCGPVTVLDPSAGALSKYAVVWALNKVSH
ncbi:MAG TPA: DUF374 domain-containing protein [Rhodopila sp.]|uniref:lysophospholipid acyltransferase family protein n=1 Tax=Rhodopila sp. TaxID=2480087 RepID=UPI002C5DF012|nr:DUF374 domain-containing protein [Rhodopila sp.]HVY15234.1 DUF374 domain-containing protein [Rhodopila sp.]